MHLCQGDAMDAESDNDVEPALPLLAHVRTLCQDPHHTQGNFDHADDEVGEEEDDGGDPDDASKLPLTYFDTYLLHILY